MIRLLIAFILILSSPAVQADNPAVALPFSTDGLVLWLNADQTELNEGRVLRWPDRSGLENHLTQSEKDLQPQLTESHGKTAVRFANSSLSLEKLNGFLSGEQKFQIFIQMRADLQQSGSPRIIDIASVESEQKYTNKRKGFWVGYEDYSLNPDSKGRLRLGVVAGAEAASTQRAWNGLPQVMEAVFAGNQRWALYENGKSVGHGRYLGDVGFLGFVGGAQLTIGQHSLTKDPSHFFNGDLFEILIFNRVLNKDEQFKVGEYLNQKFGDEFNYQTEIKKQSIFETDIQPLLVNKCVDCHSGDNPMGGLKLDSLIDLYRGGTSGSIIAPGNAQKSFLFHITASGEMPPADYSEPLSTRELELLRHWIDSGAQAEMAIDLSTLKQDTQSDHWAFQQLQRPKIPPNTAMHGTRTDIDSLIAARLQSRSLTFSNTASKLTLIRRASLDLTGLPPTPKEIQQFVQDTGQNAWPDLLDRLMASQHFGERWGRHWLDGVGYSDTNSLDNDQAIVKPAKGKWRYRDYVIQSFNTDKPYDTFLKEQLAGDELVDWRNAKVFDQSIKDHLIATTMLRCAPDDTDQDELNILSIRYYVLHRTAESVAQNLLGLTMQCCKCHDHKFEPISQRDYYRFTANFTTAWQPRDWLKPANREIMLLSDSEIAAIEKEKTAFQSEIDAIVEVGRQELLNRTLMEIPDVIREDVLSAQKIEKDKRNEVQKYLTEKFGESFAFNQAQVMPTMPTEKQNQVTVLTNELNQLNRTLDNSWAQAVYDVGSDRPTYILRRGEHEKPGAEVEAGVFSVIDVPTDLTAQQPGHSDTSGRRLALALQLTNWSTPTGALTARVRVNRIWQHLFGVGIVETAANFGESGVQPTHPELLEYLASYFIEHNRQLKPFLKQILTSQVYMQASVIASDAQAQRAAEIDPQNKLLWRQNLRRMEAEAIRDSVLVASGRLNPTMGGRFDDIVNLPSGMVVEAGYNNITEATTWRRSVYLLNRRNYHPTVLQVFDQPLLIEACQQRDASASVSQSLWMLNSEFLGHQAQALARRIQKQAPDNLALQLEQLFQYTLGRPISDDERKTCTDVFQHHFEAFTKEDPKTKQAYQKALASVCQVVFSTNEFIYIQ
ncbi:MAG: hypothetical protein CMJ76_03840 [Planctomycetaceae bacterium]|nr:hypothetical protein [Planctomycetaceae bacterium]|tara:strand:- start:1522 stop:4863 length:3342 start_codon:yes stop_codon:yes gene_type:complete